ncbi:ABC transporter permease [Hymenobacter seoulensis]
MGRTLLAAWLILSCLFLLSRAVTDRASYVQSLRETDARIGRIEQELLVQQLQQRAGLDNPLFYITLEPKTGWQWHGPHNQYHHWAGQLFRGDLGTSFRTDTPVAGLLSEALRYTLPLTVLAALLSTGLALVLGTFMSLHLRWRPLVLGAVQVLQGFPLFLVAVALLLLLANPDALAWFPAFGLGPDDTLASWWEQPGRLLYYLALPILSLVLVSVPGLVVQLDGALQQELTRLYVATARAKGASRRRVIWHHALRNALLPTITLLTELLPNLVAGSVVVEVLFALPGMGRLLADAAATHDYPVLLGGVVLVVITRLLAQVLADVLYQVADPRIKLAS